MTLTVTQAAAKAGVSPSTIRHWCRIGAVAATKIGRRWHIDPASLDYRISLTRPRKEKKVLTVENLVAIGGREWRKGDKHRVYFNHWPQFAGLEIERYNSGNIHSASLNGEPISNNEARRIGMTIDTVWYDVPTGQFYVRWGWGSPRSMTREELFQAVVANIRKAAANA